MLKIFNFNDYGALVLNENLRCVTKKNCAT